MAPDRGSVTPPVGVRDLGPAAAGPVFSVQRALIDVMRRHGFERVMTPSFDAVEALASSDEGRRRLFRFVDPESGQVVALRDDVTPQVARLVATRLGPDNAPYRLCYSARVYRRRSHFGIAPRELIQAGAELIGVAGAAADLEVLELAVRCVEALELSDQLTFSLGHSQVLRELLSSVAVELGPSIADTARLACRRRAVPAIMELLAARPALARAFEVVLMGDTTQVNAAIAPVCPRAAAALSGLEQLANRAKERLPGVRWTLDLAAERGLAYYTGVSFMSLMDGVGRPLLSGGRYDDLVGRFGADMPAVGFMVDEQAVLEALAVGGRAVESGQHDVLVVPRGGDEGALVDALRRADGALSVVRSVAPERWCELGEVALLARLKRRRFRLLVFVDPEGFQLVQASGPRQHLRAVVDVVSAARH